MPRVFHSSRSINGRGTTIPGIRSSDSTAKLVDHALALPETADREGFRRAHRHAIHALAACLPAREAAFCVILRRLADHFLLTDATVLSDLLASLENVPIGEGVAMQWLRFYEALVRASNSPISNALAALDSVLDIPDLDPEIGGRTLNARAYHLHLAGRPDAAVDDVAAAVELACQRGDRREEGKALLTWGILAYGLRDYDEATTRLDSAARCFQDVGDPRLLARVHNEQGLLFRDLGRLPQALNHFEAAAEQCRVVGNLDYVGRAINNIGEVQLFQGNIDEAAASFRDALVTMQTQAYRVDALLNLGLTCQVTGDNTSAHELFAKALDLTLTLQRRDLVAEAHFRLGDCLWRLGQDDAALDQLRAAVAIIEQTFGPMGNELLKIRLLGRWQQVYETLVLHCLAVGRTAEAFAWAERARSRAFADIVRRHGSGLPNGEPADAEPTPGACGGGPALTSAVADAGAPDMAPNVAILCYFTTGVLDRDMPLVKALHENSAVRDALATPARTILFVLTHTGIEWHDCAVDPNILSTIQSNASGRLLEQGIRGRLHRALLMPAGAALEADLVYIVPHGPLHHVPFSALESGHGRPVIHTGGPLIAFAPSVAILMQRCAAPSPVSAVPPRMCLAVGYNGVRLRHAEHEAEMVADLADGVAAVGPGAKLAWIRTEAPNHRMLHFACHGEFDESMPLESFLEIGAGEIITASEVIHNWRLTAELVILSACETGVARILTSDEPMGLIRAFMGAGARTIVVTQWRVADLPTILLMHRFYRGLVRAQHAHPARALQEAQVWLRSATVAAITAETAGIRLRDLSADLTTALDGLSPTARPFTDPTHWAAFKVVDSQRIDGGSLTSALNVGTSAIGTRSNTA